jgi:hypothetical protein
MSLAVARPVGFAHTEEVTGSIPVPPTYLPVREPRRLDVPPAALTVTAETLLTTPDVPDLVDLYPGPAGPEVDVAPVSRLHAP